MLIRSQDMETLFDMTGSTIIVRLDNSIEGFRNNKEEKELTIILGYYETKERAIEVLDEIYNTYIGLNCIDRKTGIAVVKNGIYQMPEE